MISQSLLLTATAGPGAADDPSPDPGPITITLTPERSARICDQRIPALLARIDRATEEVRAARPGGSRAAEGGARRTVRLPR